MGCITFYTNGFVICFDFLFDRGNSILFLMGWYGGDE